MIERLGIIPAAGKAERWRGMPKELMPVDDVTFIDRVIMSLYAGNADVILLVTNPEKAALHIQHLNNEPICYAIQQGKQDAWSAICESLPLNAGMNYYAMPDTYFDMDIFARMPEQDFNIGYFETDEPERFGVVTEFGGVVDKHPLKGTQKAWGVLSWSYKVADFWKQNINRIETHTQAFNMAMKEFGYSMTKLEYYHDVANYEYYKRLLNGI
jgi:hypothetical protein